VRMVQRGEDLRLAVEPGEPLRVARERGGKDLDRDLTVETGVDRLPHHTHPALADRLDEAVVQQNLSRAEPPPGILKGTFPFYFSIRKRRIISAANAVAPTAANTHQITCASAYAAGNAPCPASAAARIA